MIFIGLILVAGPTIVRIINTICYCLRNMPFLNSVLFKVGGQAFMKSHL